MYLNGLGLFLVVLLSIVGGFFLLVIFSFLGLCLYGMFEERRVMYPQPSFKLKEIKARWANVPVEER